MLVPLALAILLVATPASEGRGCRRSGCGSGYSSSYAPSYCVVGYKTEMHTVWSHEYVTEKRNVQVTEWKTEKEKRKVTRYKSETVTEKRPYTYWVNEMQKQTRTEEYWVCEARTGKEERTVIEHERIETKKKGTRQVYRNVVVEQPREYQVDQGHWETRCEERVCYSRRHCGSGGCYTTTVHCNVWVPKLVTVKDTVKVHKCVPQEETYDYVEVTYKPNTKKVMVDVVRHENVKKTRTVDVWVCNRVEKKGENTYTYLKSVPVEEEVLVDVSRPVQVTREIEVRVCRPVQKQVEVKVPIYGCVAPSVCHD